MADCEIYPEELSREVRQDPKRSAEIPFYDALRDQLGFGWVAFYDVAWFGKRRKGITDGQCDFVVAHPKHGILLIELKGGQISYDASRRTWISRNRYSVDYTIQPFSQVRDSKYALLEKLKELPGNTSQWIELAHAVAFSEVTRPGEAITPDAPPEIIIGLEDLDGLQKRIESVLAYSHKISGQSFEHGEYLIAQLKRLLGRSTRLPNPLAFHVRQEEKEILRLTDSQVALLDFMGRVRRAAIGGGAGSGKTFMAAEKAKRLAGQGFRTLLTFYNSPLCQFLSGLTREVENLDILTFEQLCGRYLTAEPATENGDLDSRASALFDAMSSADEGPYDAIIVDEGQDFDSTWWLALESCLVEGKESVLYVFYDSHQLLYEGRGNLPADLQEFPLEENVRNTQAICEVLAPHYTGDIPIRPRGPVGRKVETMPYRTQQEMAKLLRRTLTRLLDVEGFRSRDIVVLTPKLLDADSFLLKMNLGNRFSLAKDAEAKNGDQVLCSSIHDFKGLERNVVIVTELDGALPDSPEVRTALYYVGFSRAKHHLIAMGEAHVLDQVVGGT